MGCVSGGVRGGCDLQEGAAVMATNDELRAAINLLKQAAMDELPYGYTVTLVVGTHGINVTAERQVHGNDILLGFYDRWNQAISAAKADAKRRAE